MSAVPISHFAVQTAPAAPSLRAVDNPRERIILNHLRMVALRCRAAARTEFFQACSVLSDEKTEALEAYSEIVLRTLSQVTDSKQTFYRPGTEELSFDEKWLCSMITALQRDDELSFSFLLRSRVPKEKRRNFAFLMRRISEQFSQI